MTKRLKGVANLPLAPFVGVLFGMVAAILVFNTPAWMLEKLVSTIGLASILPAAAPPLGDTARSLLAVIVGVLVALRQRDRTGEGLHVDVAMLDAMVAMTDLVMNLW